MFVNLIIRLIYTFLLLHNRSRSGSFTQEEFVNMRPRCYSFHLNSEGHAARMNQQHRIMADKEGNEHLKPDSNQFITPDVRRSTVGATYGLHARKHALAVDRSSSHMNRGATDQNKSTGNTPNHEVQVVKFNTVHSVVVNKSYLYICLSDIDFFLF